MMRTRATIAGILLVAAVGCRGGDEIVLAEVEGRPIAWDAFRTSYTEYLASTGLPDEPRRRMGHLERLVSMELVRRDALDSGLADSDALHRAEERARRRLLVDAWLWEAGFDTISVDESELEALFVRVNTEVTARHLYAPTRDRADALATRLRSGESFESLAGEVFADPALAANGGSLGTFGFDEMDPAFEEVAFTIPVGEISDPVRTSQGWSVVRVDDRHVKPVISESEFAGRIPQLRAYVVERERTKVRRAVMEQTWTEAAPTLVPEAVDRLLAVLGPAPTGAETLEPSDVLIRFAEAGEEKTWTVAEFMDAAEYTDESQREAVRDASSFEAFATGLVIRRILMDRALDAGLDHTDRFRNALASAMDSWIYDRGYDRIAATAPVPEDSLRAYFDEHADEFTMPERVELREIVVEGAGTADSIRAALASESFSELARRHSLSTGTASDGGRLGPISREELGPLADRVFDAPEGAVIGPVPMRGFQMLLEVGARSPARPARYEEIRDDIETLLRRRHRAGLVRERARALRDRYTVRYEDVDLAALPLRAEPVVSS